MSQSLILISRICVVLGIATVGTVSFTSVAAGADRLEPTVACPLQKETRRMQTEYQAEFRDGAAGGQGVAEGRDPKDQNVGAAPKIDWKNVNLFTLEGETLDGERLPLSTLTGRVLLIVNVASACGYTRQYADLQALHERFGKAGLTVIGVPSNEFGNQEPGTAEEILEFCTSRFGVTFPLLTKAEVKPGEKQHPIFRALVARTDEAPKWNFTKYLVARDGVRATAYASRVSPSDEAFVEVLERLLAEPVPAGAEPRGVEKDEAKPRRPDASNG